LPRRLHPSRDQGYWNRLLSSNHQQSEKQSWLLGIMVISYTGPAPMTSGCRRYGACMAYSIFRAFISTTGARTVSAFPGFLCRGITRSTGCVARVAKRGYIRRKKLDHMVLMARTLAGVIGVTSGRVSHFEEQAGGIVHCPTKNFDRSQVLSFHRGTVERIICQN
jgi:hypothetical protein